MNREKQINAVRIRIQELRKDSPRFSAGDSPTFDSVFLSPNTRECILDEFSRYLGVEPLDELEWVLREVFGVTP